MQYKREGFCLSYGQRREREAHGWMVVQESGTARLKLSLHPSAHPTPLQKPPGLWGVSGASTLYKRKLGG